MNKQDAIAEAVRRGKRTNQYVIVFYNADMMSPDWRMRYQASLHIDRPAHGSMVGQYNPRTGQFEDLIRE